MLVKPEIGKVTTIGDAYANVKVWDTSDLLGLIFLFSCETNDLKVKILGSLDGESFTITAVDEFTLTAAAAATEKRITEYYPWIKIQVKPSAAGQNGTLTTVAIGTERGVGKSDCLGATTDAAASATVDENAGASSAIGLLKGIKNLLIDLSGCIIAGVSKTCGWNQVTTAPCTVTCPNPASRAYIAGDRVGPASGTTLTEIPGMALANGRGGTIVMLRATCSKKSITPRLRIHFFNASNPTGLVADNAPYRELLADAAIRVGYVDMIALSTAADTAGSDCSRSQEVYAGTFPLPYTCAAGSTSLWYCIETLDGITALDNSSTISLVVKSMLN